MVCKNRWPTNLYPAETGNFAVMANDKLAMIFFLGKIFLFSFFFFFAGLEKIYLQYSDNFVF